MTGSRDVGGADGTPDGTAGHSGGRGAGAGGDSGGGAGGGDSGGDDRGRGGVRRAGDRRGDWPGRGAWRDRRPAATLAAHEARTAAPRGESGVRRLLAMAGDELRAAVEATLAADPHREHAVSAARPAPDAPLVVGGPTAARGAPTGVEVGPPVAATADDPPAALADEVDCRPGAGAPDCLRAHTHPPDPPGHSRGLSANDLATALPLSPDAVGGAAVGTYRVQAAVVFATDPDRLPRDPPAGGFGTGAHLFADRPRDRRPWLHAVERAPPAADAGSRVGGRCAARLDDVANDRAVARDVPAWRRARDLSPRVWRSAPAPDPGAARYRAARAALGDLVTEVLLPLAP